MSKKKKKSVPATKNTSTKKVEVATTKPEMPVVLEKSDTTIGIVLHNFIVGDRTIYSKILVGNDVLLHHSPFITQPIGTEGNVRTEKRKIMSNGEEVERNVVVEFVATGMNVEVNNIKVKMNKLPQLFVAHKDIILERFMQGIDVNMIGISGDNIFYTE